MTMAFVQAALVWGGVALVGAIVNCAACVHMHRLPEAKGYTVHSQPPDVLLGEVNVYAVEVNGGGDHDRHGRRVGHGRAMRAVQDQDR